MIVGASPPVTPIVHNVSRSGLAKKPAAEPEIRAVDNQFGAVAE
jgi:hypothetical protein